MLKKVPIYPFLVAAYPVLALGAYNITQIAVSDIWRPLAISLALAVLIFGLAWLLLRDLDRAAFITGLVLLLFFSYGHLYEAAKLGGIDFLRHRLLLLIFALLLVAGVIYVIRWPGKVGAWTPWLNLIAALLLIYPVSVITVWVVRSQFAAQIPARPVLASSEVSAQAQPDIYYIILDAYAREDSLQEDYQYDNSAFIKALEDRGFYVAECAQSNYAWTALSLPSSLNYSYLDQLVPEFTRTQESNGTFVKHSAIRAFLESHGYRTTAFATGFPFSEIRDAANYISPKFRADVASSFEAMFADTTMLRVADDFGYMDLENVSYEEFFRQRTLSAFKALGQIPGSAGSKFVFGHIVAPHPPYVFGPNGEDRYYGDYGTHAALLPPEDNVRGYDDQLSFVNLKTLDAIDAILAKSSVPPIIILQGDHGAPIATVSPSHRMRILSAYYAPKARALLYPGITPVNSFRVILDAYFDQRLPLLEDRSFYSRNVGSLKFEEIASSCP
jgi:hypothetical protein